MHKRGNTRFSFGNFLSHSTEKLRRGIFLCLIKILVSKIFMHKRGRGIIVLRRIFFSHSSETFRRGTLLCFRNFLVSKIVKDKRGGGYHDFPSKLFCLNTDAFGRGVGGIIIFSVVIIKLKNVGKGRDLNRYLPLQNLVVLPTVPWEQFEFLTNVSEMLEIIGTTETRTRTYCLRNFCLNPTAVI